MANVIKGSTKKGEELLARARNWEGTELWHVYGSVSSRKCEAMEWCKAQCAKDEGFDFHICSHNGFRFSVAWNYYNENGEFMTRIETADNTYIIDGSRREEVVA